MEESAVHESVTSDGDSSRCGYINVGITKQLVVDYSRVDCASDGNPFKDDWYFTLHDATGGESGRLHAMKFHMSRMEMNGIQPFPDVFDSTQELCDFWEACLQEQGGLYGNGEFDTNDDMIFISTCSLCPAYRKTGIGLAAFCSVLSALGSGVMVVLEATAITGGRYAEHSPWRLPQCQQGVDPVDHQQDANRRVQLHARQLGFQQFKDTNYMLRGPSRRLPRPVPEPKMAPNRSTPVDCCISNHQLELERSAVLDAMATDEFAHSAVRPYAVRLKAMLPSCNGSTGSFITEYAAEISSGHSTTPLGNSTQTDVGSARAYVFHFNQMCDHNVSAARFFSMCDQHGDKFALAVREMFTSDSEGLAETGPGCKFSECYEFGDPGEPLFEKFVFISDIYLDKAHRSRGIEMRAARSIIETLAGPPGMAPGFILLCACPPVASPIVPQASPHEQHRSDTKKHNQVLCWHWIARSMGQYCFSEIPGVLCTSQACRYHILASPAYKLAFEKEALQVRRYWSRLGFDRCGKTHYMCRWEGVTQPNFMDSLGALSMDVNQRVEAVKRMLAEHDPPLPRKVRECSMIRHFAAMYDTPGPAFDHVLDYNSSSALD